MPVPEDVLDAIFAARPLVHRRDTEITGRDPSDTLIPAVAPYLAEGTRACLGISRDFARYLATTLRAGHRTLETGAGLSTLIFAAAGAEHTAISPDPDEHRTIRDFALEQHIPMTVKFVAASSESYLPTAESTPLDFVLIDGKHAFPWPIVDWFFTADRLQQGGLLALDDLDMHSVRLLADFLDAEPRWEIAAEIQHTRVYRKVAASALDVSWDQQPWTIQGFTRLDEPSFAGRVISWGKTAKRKLLG